MLGYMIAIFTLMFVLIIMSVTTNVICMALLLSYLYGKRNHFAVIVHTTVQNEPNYGQIYV